MTNRYAILRDKLREKRDLRRQRVLKAGTIHFNGGYSSFNCKIKNENETGAMIECESTLGIPAEFEFSARDTSNHVAAKLIWRNGNRMGILFHN